MFLYFCSGAGSLIDEVVWVRLLKLTLGNTVYASSIVVSVFMGGLALGALIMARFADRVRNRLRLYALLEICATISALLLPLALKFADGIYRWFFVKYHPLSSSLYLVQIIVSTVILLVPTLAMGSTLPLLGRYVTSLQYRIGSLVGRSAQYSPYNASVQDNFGDIYMELNQVDKAIEHYNHAIQLKPSDAYLHFKLALVFLWKGLLDQSISQFNQGLQIQPLNSTAHCHLADVLAQKGLTDDAINHYRQAFRTNPNYGRARDRLNELLNK
jgi:tetratricopeptide (TPR) repeat protein